jgi:four helix bundle protein
MSKVGIETTRNNCGKVTAEHERKTMPRGDTRYDLEDRLIDFALMIIEITEKLPQTRAGNHIAGQIIRSGTAPAPNYGEAQSAESKSDFIHKMKICLKELRETRIWLTMIIRKPFQDVLTPSKAAHAECEELTRIFVKSLQTAQRKR